MNLQFRLPDVDPGHRSCLSRCAILLLSASLNPAVQGNAGRVCPSTCLDVTGCGKTDGRAGWRTMRAAGPSTRRVAPHSRRTRGDHHSRLEKSDRFPWLGMPRRRTADVGRSRETRLKAERAQAGRAWTKDLRKTAEPARKNMTRHRASANVWLDWHAHLAASRLFAGAQCRFAGASGIGGASVVSRPQYGLGRRSMTQRWRLQPHACTSSREPAGRCAADVTVPRFRKTA